MTTFYNTFNDDDTLPSTSNLAGGREAQGVKIVAGSTKVSIDPFTGEVTTYGPQSINTTPAADKDGLAISSKTGAPVARAPQKDDVVTLPNGMTVRYDVAVRTGLITPEGTLNATEEAPEVAPKDHPEVDTIEPMDAPTEALLSELASSTSPSSQVAALVDFQEHGTITDATINRLASEAGIHPEEMTAKVSTIVKGFQAQADKALSSFVTDPSSVYEWARQADPQGLKQATQELTMKGSSKGFQALGARFFETADRHSPELIEDLPWAPGVTLSKGTNGETVVHHSKGSDPWRTLVRSGRLSLYLSQSTSAKSASSGKAGSSEARDGDWVKLPGGTWFNTRTAEVRD